MAYLGRQPVIGNFVKLDAISVVNGQAAYTMQNGGVNFTSYDNVNQFLVSLNGILQSPTDSFTVSGSTLTFASNLSTGDVIDFVMVLGNTLDIGTPSDNTVTTAKLADSSVTTAKLNDASVSLAKLTATGTKDSTTFLRGDNTFAEPGGGSWILLDTQTVTGTPSSIETGAVFSSTYDTYVLVIRRMNLGSPSSIRLQIGTSGSFLASGYRWSGSGVKEGTSLVTGSSSSTILELMGGTSGTYFSNSEQDCLSGVIWIHNPFNSSRTSIHAELSWESGVDTASHLINFSGHPATSSSYDRWKLSPSSGNFEATTIIQTFGVINA